MPIMDDTRAPRQSRRGGAIRFGLLLLGSILMIAAPLVGWVPGPGGTIVFAIGLGLVLRNSLWAKRRYVDFKRRFPRPAGIADWGMRRPSHKRRTVRDKAQRDARNG
jgi:hypothetical protein